MSGESIGGGGEGERGVEGKREGEAEGGGGRGEREGGEKERGGK